MVGGAAKIALFDRGLLTARQHGFDLPRAVYDSNDLNGLTLPEIYSHVGVYDPKSVSSGRDRRPSMAKTWVSSELYECLSKLRHHLVCAIFTIVCNIIPNLENVRFGLGSE
jgi:hypothetical protein